MPARDWLSVPMICTSGLTLPSALRNDWTDSPISFMAPTASSAGAISRSSIVLSDVPASDPLTPLFARTARAADVSLIDWLARAATADTIENDCDRSSIDVLDASAADEMASAAVLASTPKTFIASAITTAAAATSICPTLANWSAVSPAPPSTCSRLWPALSSSRKPAAASVGPTPSAADTPLAAVLTRSRSAAVAPVLARMFRRTDSYAEPWRMAAPNGASAPAPTAMSFPPAPESERPMLAIARLTLLRAAKKARGSAPISTNTPPAFTLDELMRISASQGRTGAPDRQASPVVALVSWRTD